MRYMLTIAVLVMFGWSEFTLADTIVAARTIPARTVITANDVRAADRPISGALSHVQDVLGREARTTIYNGRPIKAADIGPPALIERNDIVRLRFASDALVIEADGRALGRGAAGERISVMNLASRATVVGKITEDGSVEVTR